MNFILKLFRKIFKGKKPNLLFVDKYHTPQVFSHKTHRVENFAYPFKLNLEPDPTDERDYKYVPKYRKRDIAAIGSTPVPQSDNTFINVDLREDYNWGEIKNQGRIGSCQSFAVAGVVQALHNSPVQDPDFDLSELFLYYQARKESGFPADQDVGAYLRDTLKTANKEGIALETYWPYVSSNFSQKPAFEAYFSARFIKTSRYERVWSVTDIYSAILEGNPVILGMQCPVSFLTYSGGVYEVSKDPKVRAKDGIVGGHAVILTGFSGDTFHGRNSWSTSWGMQGEFDIHEDTLRLLLMDSWILEVKSAS